MNTLTVNKQRICWSMLLLFTILIPPPTESVDDQKPDILLSACEHLKRTESKRARSLETEGLNIPIPSCTNDGEFSKVQCTREFEKIVCWCVDDYGAEIIGTRSFDVTNMECNVTKIESGCPQSSCRMFCPAGFARDARSGCSICKCRDPCENYVCPGGQMCEPVEVKCKSEPCPPIPSCRRARSLTDLCPAGLPLAIANTTQPFLCGNDPGKPTCPPLHECLVHSGNDYGVCCPTSEEFKKPGTCPDSDMLLSQNEFNYGFPCSHDLECPNLAKCCRVGNDKRCLQPQDQITPCQQARLMADMLQINSRDGTGYMPNCNETNGKFIVRQCSRNGLVCWCVNPQKGDKIPNTMGAAYSVNCKDYEFKFRKYNTLGRSFNNDDKCDKNICAGICEYGFKNDHNGCPSCECSEPCEGYQCSPGFHCEVIKNANCSLGPTLCSSEPICKPNIVYSNPCNYGTPLVNESSDGTVYCKNKRLRNRKFQDRAFFNSYTFENDDINYREVTCPANYKCTKLRGDSKSVCCPISPDILIPDIEANRNIKLCSFIRELKRLRQRQRNLVNGIEIPLSMPKCSKAGEFEPLQCKPKMSKKSSRKLNHKSNDEDKFIIRLRRSATRTLRLLPIELNDINRNSSKKDCWCVDENGTEIPGSKNSNATKSYCSGLRTALKLKCDISKCDLYCAYGYNYDPITKCPVCECRDPCKSTNCSNGADCQMIEVPCESSYCPPVPVCLMKKSGQCPYLIPPARNDTINSNACTYECKSDFHCDGTKKCCSNGCGTQCIEPQLKTACQHTQAIQIHQASEIGVPAKQKYIAQCDDIDGSWKSIQCGPNNTCWCVDKAGNEISGTRSTGKQPNCTKESEIKCPLFKCSACEHGFVLDSKGCQTCECRNPCNETSCPAGESCDLIDVECTDRPCPKMAICVPRRESICEEGFPLQLNGTVQNCGAKTHSVLCPTTHNCQIDPLTHNGVCCRKPRDVCYESIERGCTEDTFKDNDKGLLWTFNVKYNKCVRVSLKDTNSSHCQFKNLFNSESTCKQVCPELSQCERLKLQNSLLKTRTRKGSSLFQPRCDHTTGLWKPVQCFRINSSEEDRSFPLEANMKELNGTLVCWCSDRKGAPLKGTLSKDKEPTCSYRQARNRVATLPSYDPEVRALENMIDEIVLLSDDFDLNETDAIYESYDSSSTIIENVSQTQQSIDRSSNFDTIDENIETRCQSLQKTATFPLKCDEQGAFVPMQCSDEICWCVDAAGNQLSKTPVFQKGEKNCEHTPIHTVNVALELINKKESIIQDASDNLRKDVTAILGLKPENFKSYQNAIGNVIVEFDLKHKENVELAFALENLIKQNRVTFFNDQLVPDPTLSRFNHHILIENEKPLPMPYLSTIVEDATIQTIVYVAGTTSAFLISILVAYITLKSYRQSRKPQPFRDNSNDMIKSDIKSRGLNDVKMMA